MATTSFKIETVRINLLVMSDLPFLFCGEKLLRIKKTWRNFFAKEVFLHAVLCNRETTAGFYRENASWMALTAFLP